MAFAAFIAGIAATAGCFGIGLLVSPAEIAQGQRDLLLIGLGLIVCSVTGAIVTFMGVVFTSVANSEYESWRAFRIALAFQNIALVVGLIVFAILIVIRFASQMPYSSMTVRNANAAVATALLSVPKGTRILKIDRVDVIRGLSTSDSSGIVWYVSIIVCGPRECSGTGSPREMDVMIDAASGKSIVAGR